MDAPERLTRQYWNRELKLQKISPERTKEFFEAVIGKYYTKLLNLYIGNDGMYYVYFPNVYEYNDKSSGSLLDNTGISKKMILTKGIKEYQIFTEQTLRAALYNISCVSYDDFQPNDEKKLKIYQKYGPLYREKRSIMLQGGPIPTQKDDAEENNDGVFNTSLYGKRIIRTVTSEEETKQIMFALYGKTDEDTVFEYDLVKGEYFIHEETRSKNSYDLLQIEYDFDYNYLEQYVQIQEKFKKPTNDDEYWKISDYFHSKPYIINTKWIKTGLFQHMLEPNDNNASNIKYRPISLDNLQKAYATVIYNHRETW